MNYKYLFFDLDRTLWDYDANSRQALSFLYEEFNLQKFFTSFEEFHQLYSANNDYLWDLYRKGGTNKNELRSNRFALTLANRGIENPALAVEIGEAYMDLTPRLNILAPNTVETLNYLKKKHYKMYILTNGFMGTQETKVKHSAIEEFFIRIYSSEELGINKPKKEIFHWAVTSVHAKKQECLMIGDDLEVDIKGAMQYGIDAAWYNPLNEESAFKPTILIQDLSELINIL